MTVHRFFLDWIMLQFIIAHLMVLVRLHCTELTGGYILEFQVGKIYYISVYGISMMPTAI